MQDSNYQSLWLLPVLLAGMWAGDYFAALSPLEQFLGIAAIVLLSVLAGLWLFNQYSTWGRERKKRLERIHETPHELLRKTANSVVMGQDEKLGVQVVLPDHVRTRHVHILGATGSGKTESVILNFIRQDVSRGIGCIILDAKGDRSFLRALKDYVPEDRLFVFDLGEGTSAPYNPLSAGSPLEAAQRLFSSLTWSEEYYKSKALSALQKLFQTHYEINERNPNLHDLTKYLETPESYSAFVMSDDFPQSLALKEFQDLSGLRDQIRSLTMGHLGAILSSGATDGIQLSDATNGAVIYFRLQSLMSPQIVATVGRLVINHLNFLAGTAHRGREAANAKQSELVPVYLDEFATFACAEFADLISKARSAGFALHFSHQSIGDLTEVSPGFLNRITDNAATKIILRINDPDSAEYFARSFGTRLIQKTTQRITNTKDIEAAEIVGEGTTREAHQFRASPDMFKTLPTGVGAVLIAHGRDTPHGASSVFRVRFPEIERLPICPDVSN